MRKSKLRMKYTLTVGLARVDEMEEIIATWNINVLDRKLLDGKPSGSRRTTHGTMREREYHPRKYKTIPDDVICNIYAADNGNRGRAAIVGRKYGVGTSTVSKIWALTDARHRHVLAAHNMLDPVVPT